MNVSTRRRVATGAALLALLSTNIAAAHAFPTIDAATAPGCTGELDTRHPNLGVQFDVTGPDTIDPTKDITFKLKGSGINPASTPGASNGVYVVLTPTRVWRLNHCSTMTGDGDALVARWIPAAVLEDNGGKLDLDLLVEANTLQPGQTYTVGIMAAHALALSERYFDRGVTFKVPSVTTDHVATPSNVRGEIDQQRNVTVAWDYPESVPGTAWRAQIECVEHCTSTKTLRSLDLSDPNARTAKFDDADPGVYQASVNASRWVNGKFVTTDFGTSTRFVVGDVDKPISQRLYAAGIAHEYGEYVAPGTEITLANPLTAKAKWSVTGVKDYTVDPATQALRFTMPTNPVQVEVAEAKEAPTTTPTTPTSTTTAPAAPTVPAEPTTPAAPTKFPAWGAVLIAGGAALLAVVAGLATQSPVIAALLKRLQR